MPVAESPTTQPPTAKPLLVQPAPAIFDATPGWNTPVKAVPPAIPAAVLARPHLERMLDEGAERRLTVLVAGAGFGKSTLLAAWAAGRGCAWYTLTESDRDLATVASGIVGALRLRVPGLSAQAAGVLESRFGPEAAGSGRSRARAFAGFVADAVGEALGRDLVLVLDDMHEVGRSGPGAWFIEALVRQAPARLHLILASRDPLPFSVDRLRGQGQVTWLGAATLCLDQDETAAMIEAATGAPADAAAAVLHEATAGWPAATRLAAEALGGSPPRTTRATLDRVLRPAGPIYSYLAVEVLSRQPRAVRVLLSTVAVLPRFSAELCKALGLADAERSIRSLSDRGLFVQPLGAGEWYEVHPLISEYRAALGEPAGGARRVAARAATWFAEHGAFRDALACLREAKDAAGQAELLRAHGKAALAGGDIEAVITAAGDLPAANRDATIERLEGEARQAAGDWEGALACFRRLAGSDGPIDAAVAWRMGLIHHLRGELDEALEIYRRGRVSGGDRREVALLRAWMASAQWLRGDTGARDNAALALRDATASGDDQALAAAHTVAALVAALDGDRRANDAHYLRALDHAGRAGDLLQAIRIRDNRGSRFIEEGYFEEAIAELDTAIQSADIAGFAAFHALGLSNRGVALWRLGRLDEAIGDLEAARRIYQRLESRFVSYPLGHLGDVYRERGAFALSRSCFEEAVAVAEAAGDLQGLRPALAGLAEVIAVDEPERAARLAERAVDLGHGVESARTLLALGRVRLARGDARGAGEAARDAAIEAGSRRDRAGLAAALVLEALAVGKAAVRRERLGEALVIWHDLGSPIEQARVELMIAGLDSGPDADDRARDARRALQAAGAHPIGWPFAAPAADARRSVRRATLVVRTLGGFEVVRDGRPIALGEWGSKKARDLFKILLSRRGQRTPRDQLKELLWPNEEPARAGRRLSVVLSTARGVLDPDRRHEPDWTVTADRETIGLAIERVEIDVEVFLASAAAGLSLLRDGRLDEAQPRLEAAEAAYRGDFLGEDAYDDWAVGLREEARNLYIEVGHALARMAAARSDQAAAAMYLRRVLERDPYDEPAHLGLVAALVAAGRPGEARRAYGAYLDRMEELGAEAAAFPA